jgi:hypothetical protein
VYILLVVGIVALMLLVFVTDDEDGMNEDFVVVGKEKRLN